MTIGTAGIKLATVSVDTAASRHLHDKFHSHNIIGIIHRYR